MNRKVKTHKTAEQRKAEAAALQASITEQVEQLRDSDAWHRFLTFAHAFHNYSLNNLFLILAQNPAAMRVAGFRKWQELGRQVRKGEHGLKIFGFAERKAREGETPSRTNAKGEDVVGYFPLVSVFDISQTDATDTWEDPDLAHRLTGSDSLGIFDATADYMAALGWTVTRYKISGDTNGFTTLDGTRQIVVDSMLTDAQAAKTMLHEAAHAIMHADDAEGDYVAHRGTKECEAESVAYIVAGILGLDTTEYSIGYVAGWTNADTETIRSTADRVLRAAHQIADAITSEATEEVEKMATAA